MSEQIKIDDYTSFNQGNKTIEKLYEKKYPHNKFK